MPGMFIFAIVLAIIASLLGVASLVTSRLIRKEAAVCKAREEVQKADSQATRYHDPYDYPSSRGGDRLALHTIRSWTRGVGLGVLALAGLMTFMSSATVVSTKNVGIVTSFGRPTGSLSNGFHLVAPWEKVTELDAAIQTDSHYQKEKNGCISVRIVRQAVACVDVSIKWRIKESTSDELFKNYRAFDNIRDSLVTRELNSTLNQVFESYDPLGIDASGQSTAPTMQTLSTQVTSAMQAEVGNSIEVISVIIALPHFDGNTQSRVDALQAQVAQTRIAQQAAKTAEQQANANNTLSKSVSNDPNVLVSKCFDLLNEMINKGQNIPTGFSCWPGGSSAVVVPAAPNAK